MRSIARLSLLASVIMLPITAFAADVVTLTHIPQLTEQASNTDITSFLNGLYKLCIGIAVVLSVVQLIRAGITYMTAAGSVGSTEQAKHLISTSLLGLLLVLSPYIVFSVINPQILSLHINVEGIKPNQGTPGSPSNNTNTNTNNADNSDFTPGSSSSIGPERISACKARGCSVVGDDTGLTCTCPAPETTTATSTQTNTATSTNTGANTNTAAKPGPYKWSGVLSCANNTGGFSNRPAGAGPYNTQAECYASYNSEQNCSPDPKQFTCSCDKPMSEQPGC